jgi:hypothetical protein
VRGFCDIIILSRLFLVAHDKNDGVTELFPQLVLCKGLDFGLIFVDAPILQDMPELKII